jgi:SlyX protein
MASWREFIEVVMKKRVEDVEVRMAYLEATVETLNQVVIDQQNRIDLLVREMQTMKQQLEAGAEFVRPQSEDTPPPHY